ncbi:MAG TPA: signal peptidase I, partial [Solirubrobacteraceae bacterium]|nr:signal peptidase I [Solirubrobacteraceae bacterium]
LQMRAIELTRGNQLVEFVLVVVVALGLAFLVQAFVVKPYSIPTGSMEPTLIPGQRVLVDRIGNDFFNPSIGDIVVFHPPAGATVGGDGVCGVKATTNEPCPRPTAKESSETYIKRVVAVGGDTIAIRDGQVILNGKLQREPFADIAGCAGDSTCTYPKPIKVPAGYYFMMGDNRGNSDDSRFWGPVPDAWIIGEAFATYWPPDRIGFF